MMAAGGIVALVAPLMLIAREHVAPARKAAVVKK